MKRIAFIHRYGLEGWICCGGHAIPHVIEALSTDTEVHFFGPHSIESVDPTLRALLTVHELPYTHNRANPTDKITKTLLWYLCLPWIAIRCRFMGVKLIWNDETIPLTAPLLRLFFGKNVAITVMDFFMRIYTQNHPSLRWLCNLVEWIDLQSWKKLPIIFTKVLYTQEYLAGKGVPKEIMHLYRNPIDHTKFHPVDQETRVATRAKYGYTDEHIVMTHHGILHPNKGNDWILQRLAELKESLPQLRFLLIGNGPEMHHLKKLTKKLKIEEIVTFAGWLPTEAALNNALASTDIGLVMRIGQETDNFHMTDTLAHEMACGNPIIAVNLKGIAEVIKDGENGFLFSPDTPEEFTSKLKQLTTSPDLRRRTSENLLKLSHNLTNIDISAKNIHATIHSTL